MEPQIIAFDLLKTEIIEYQETKYTIRLNRNKNDQYDYIFIVNNETTEKTKKYHFAEVDVMDFFQHRGESLFDVIPEIIKDDIESGKI
jgi:hypothetical protein